MDDAPRGTPQGCVFLPSSLMLAAAAFFCSVNTAGINAAVNVALLTFEGGLSQKRAYKSA